MPTRTTNKTAARKTAAPRKPVRSAAPSESAPAPKSVAAKSAKLGPPIKPVRSSTVAATPAARSRAAAEAAAASAAPAEAPVAKPVVETVSLIDEKKPRPKREGAPRTTQSFLPPISRIVATPEPPASTPAPPPPPPVAPPPKPAPVVTDLISGPAPAAPKRVAPPEAPAPVAEVAAVPAEDAPPTETEAAPEKIIHIKPPIVVKDLALQLGVKNFQLIKELMTDFNVFSSGPTQTIEPDIATQICAKHGFVFEMERREKGGGVHKVEQVVVAPPPPVIEKEEELKNRGPIITFMGHVDHGKTSLMDAIRKTRVAKGEAGGITQHIGAYTVDYKGTRITFLDTPGHAAFTAMRARGAHVTDIVVLVVAADDGLMPQTIEAINHAKAAEHVKIMVAINKIDVPGANIDRVKKQLQERDLSPEDWGGETIVVPVSATKGIGIDELLENMAVQAEVMDLKSSPTATPRGTVIEATVEAGRGPTATVIVQMGTLKTGDPFICGDFGGKVKSLVDDNGKPIKEAGPSTPVKVLGFMGLPHAGDEFLVMESERSAKTLSEERQLERRADKLSTPQRATLESLLEAADGKKHLRIILKTDAQGSLEALITALGQIESKKIDLEIVHSGVGPISENDVLLASASNAVVIGFTVKVESMAVNVAKREGVQVKLYSIIYELIDQIKESMAEMLDPEHRETVIGHAEVKQVFKLTRGIVAGCLVTDGRISRTGRARVLRRRQPVYDGGLSTLRRFQDDVKEVRVGLECGIKLGDFNEYQVGDIIECYQLEQVAQKL